MKTSLLNTDVPKTPTAEASVEGDTIPQLAVRIERLSKTYPGGTQPAVKDLSLDVYDGEIENRCAL
jgi:hypothetical protein